MYPIKKKETPHLQPDRIVNNAKHAYTETIIFSKQKKNYISNTNLSEPLPLFLLT